MARTEAQIMAHADRLEDANSKAQANYLNREFKRHGIKVTKVRLASYGLVDGERLRRKISQIEDEDKRRQAYSIYRESDRLWYSRHDAIRIARNNELSRLSN